MECLQDGLVFIEKVLRLKTEIIMGEIRYSIITPHKNSPLLLNRLLESIPMRADIEIIIIDDNSDQNLKPHITRDKTKVIYLEANESKGAGHARNIGLAEAKGEWLLFPDSDDYYVKGFLDALDGYTGGDYEVVYFNFVYKDEESGLNISHSIKECIDSYDGSVLMTDKTKFLNIPPWNKMVRSSYILKYGIQFEEVLNGNDLFFSMRVGFHANKIIVVKEPLYVYVKNNCGLSNKKTVSTEAHLCRVGHVMQLNRFYSYIGHAEWKSSLILRILRSCRSGGWKFVYSLFFQFPGMVLNSNKLVKLVKPSQE